MKRLFPALDQLDPAMVSVVGALPQATTAVAAERIKPYVCAMRRKCSSLIIHHGILTGIDWSRLDSLGRKDPLDGSPTRLDIPLPDARLVLDHRSAVIDHVYMAFDALVAGIVNVTDTFARLTNSCYQLGIPERQATVFSVADHIPNSSPLGQVVSDRNRTDWLRYVRDLRGRCQHADVEEVLETCRAAFGRGQEPVVPARYTWTVPQADAKLTAYVQSAAVSGADLMLACINAIASDPAKAVV